MKQFILGVACMIISICGQLTAKADTPMNQLSRAEQISGWRLLFDGQSADQFRNYKQESLSSGWQVSDGSLVRSGAKAGDIVTKEKFKYFELSLEYNISPGGNSGIMFHVAEGDGPAWRTGPEIQVQDNQMAHDPELSGWLYQLYTPGKEGGKAIDATRPSGQWNQVFLRISPQNCDMCMNGVRYYSFKLGGQDWDDRVAKSKFAKFPQFGKVGEGHICLQDHGNLVAYRNIKIRPLNEDGSLPQAPVDGKLEIDVEAAFPKMEWEGYEPIDENGTANRQLRVMELTYAQGVPGRLFAATQNGVVYTFDNSTDVQKASIVLDLRDKVSQWWVSGANNEQGLLGLAMHPRFKENGQFFVSYTLRSDNSTVISRFTISDANAWKVDAASEEILLQTDQPFRNHNGGPIEFGPDGFLYIGLGDGGLRNDPELHGQNLGTLLGSILRIDVDRPTGEKKYGIPEDNPFVKTTGAQPEIFAFGIRNPWRIAFDKSTGALWCGDVGQELWEEINIIVKGGNYGWNSREGTKPFSNKEPHGHIAPLDPVWEYDHGIGKSITGGRVYLSGRLPDLAGKYLYADYVSGGVWALSFDPTTGKVTRNEEIVAGGLPVLSFGEDENGEIYFATDNGNAQCIHRFRARSTAAKR